MRGSPRVRVWRNPQNHQKTPKKHRTEVTEPSKGGSSRQLPGPEGSGGPGGSAPGPGPRGPQWLAAESAPISAGSEPGPSAPPRSGRSPRPPPPPAPPCRRQRWPWVRADGAGGGGTRDGTGSGVEARSGPALRSFLGWGAPWDRGAGATLDPPSLRLPVPLRGVWDPPGFKHEAGSPPSITRRHQQPKQLSASFLFPNSPKFLAALPPRGIFLNRSSSPLGARLHRRPRRRRSPLSAFNFFQARLN